MSCCPPNAWPKLESDDRYTCRGVVEQVGDLAVYRVGRGPRCVLWHYDVYGFDGGRTRQLCDTLADKGFLVIMPDWYRGVVSDSFAPIPELIAFTKRHTQWANFLSDWNEKIKPYAIKHGAKQFGTMGTCWGTYPVVKFSGLPEFSVGVSMHPSHPLIFGEAMLNEDEEKALKDCKGSPQLMMPAQEDTPNVKQGGIAEKVLGSECWIVEFPEMRHGWTTRGDLKDPKVARDVAKAMATAAQFLDKHLK